MLVRVCMVLGDAAWMAATAQGSSFGCITDKTGVKLINGGEKGRVGSQAGNRPSSFSPQLVRPLGLLVSAAADLVYACRRWCLGNLPTVRPRLLVIDGFLARTTQCVCVFIARMMLDVESGRRRQLHLGSYFGPQNGPQNLPQNWGLENAKKKETNGIENVAPNWEPKLTSKRGLTLLLLGGSVSGLGAIRKSSILWLSA